MVDYSEYERKLTFRYPWSEGSANIKNKNEKLNLRWNNQYLFKIARLRELRYGAPRPWEEDNEVTPVLTQVETLILVLTQLETLLPVLTQLETMSSVNLADPSRVS